ncbi:MULTISPECIES: hypothetical protein [Halorussus]|uniref:hypothetical protein n=1 Tax=Halorussus TaxID=1070314 RepID=UPI000E210BC7|nr:MULTISPECIES: hypothetical protein [Halorussus]NHN57633.1 hypothetical protein [Halorussus sp. JP-T4]
MRRIYESEALRRDDEDPFVPNDGAERRGGHVNWDNLSHALFPATLRPYAVTVDVETDRDTYAPDEQVRFRVSFSNRLPVPVTLVTATPGRWSWSLDGLDESSELPADAPAERARLQFGRSERKLFHRRWDQRIRESEREWRAAERGEHTLAVGIDAVRGADRLTAETTFRIE